MKRIGIPLLVVIVVVGVAAAGVAGLFQAKSIEGTVSDIGANLLVLAQTSPAENQLSIVSIEVDQDTQFDKIASLNELSTGDEVKVEYNEKDGKKIATMITKVEMPQKTQPSKAQM